ncbi:NUDIX domain-containing protein [uncultured Rothia sp.]|uniref:NUDIX hydrolase n=1 Tax=uncultured Rothia sp. TaxID=316088 RepID=UPI000AA0EF91|nr:NUDIX domain-containing protein [uncultured Rothia sp.]
MPTPPYIRKLRERIGSDYLWLSGATAVVYREQDSKVLLVRRSDNGAWTPITGIVDPGESPALTCLREAQEEANVQIEVLELAQVKADPPMQFGNGDRCQFLDHTFLCRWVSGEAKVNDEESSQVRWVDVSDPVERALLSERMLDRIDAALNYDGHCRFGLESVPPEED